MRIAVTGAGGLLGAHTINAMLTQKDTAIIAVTSRTDAELRAAWRSYGLDDVSWKELKTVSTDEIVDALPALGEIDWLVNGGFPRSRDGNKLAEGLVFQQKLIERVATSDNVRALLNISSQSVYSDWRPQPAREDSQLSLDTPYAVGKFATEMLVNTLITNKPAQNIRLSSLVGVGFGQRIVNRLLRIAAETHELSITNSQTIFDFMDVRDAAAALRAIMQSNHRSSLRELNVGAGSPHTLEEIATIVAQVVDDEYRLPVTVNIEQDDSPSTSSALDVSRLRDDYGFTAAIPLSTSARDILEHDVTAGLVERKA